ncbi:hypothetical protein AAFF_G00297980 [Aldrovandia affinis]|uniref:RING-type E3 ubiquitin transferase n=1 Tax=Aldrovandia affinis TaxID=143900 RepID=A0AAD7R8P2_9TELE|nr:hypothetical protein AAFF_G00297980 [Aldrovandia affinis]
MPVQAPQWTEFLLCPICTQTFEETVRKPISLGCGHTVCKMCLNKLHRKACPFDQTTINTDIEQLPVNTALLQLVGGQVPRQQPLALLTSPEDTEHYEEARACVEELALYLKPLSCTRGVGVNSAAQSMLSRPMQRKLVTLVHCQLVEEEGRVRAMRAARSLGERTVTELILQHQNPSSSPPTCGQGKFLGPVSQPGAGPGRGAGPRVSQPGAGRGCQFLGPGESARGGGPGRGCQFLGPAMQEEALKLVLLALEDGSALSRKVLVLFVVQRLEPRFPQASKTSIGHVVQLLYRASCFKVTKRDEDSSLMQLKEEFRTYEALRREHDSQIVQIAMEGGLRIAPDQWSSLLYGDQSHKSHMQSIIDKLQTPASLRRACRSSRSRCRGPETPPTSTGSAHIWSCWPTSTPAPNSDAPPPTWEQLEKGLVAVKTVVHGLVDFIQNHSKKGADQQQPPQHSKYKTYMCRDMKQKGGCPRGASCTFAHSQEELEKYRKMNKRLAARRPLSQSLTGLNEIGGPCSPGLLPEDLGPLEGVPRKPSPLTNGSALTQLISRGADPAYDPAYDPARKAGKMEALSLSAPGSPPDPMDPVPKSVLALNPPAGVHPRMAAEHLSLPLPKHMPMGSRGPQGYAQQQPEMFYTEPRPPASASQYPTGQQYPYQPPQYVPQRYVRNQPGPSELGLPPYQELYPGYGPERQYPAPHSVAPHSYPPEGYCPVTPHPGQMRPYVRESYGRSQPSLDYLHRRRKEIMAQLEERKVISPPPFAPSPTLPRPFPPEYPQEQYMEESLKAFGKCREADYAGQYSPWSCGTIGSYMVTKEVKPKDAMATGAMEMSVEGKGLRDSSLEAPRRSAEVKDDDPIIPFGPLPTVSRFGAISRTSKSGYQPPGPMQAVACAQGANPKHITVAEYTYANHGGWSGASYPQHQATPSQGGASYPHHQTTPTQGGASYPHHQTTPTQAHFSERLPLLAPDREQLKMELQQVNQQINQHTQIHSMEAASSGMLLQRDSGAKWPAGGVSSEQLSLELHHVEREIGKRTREIAMENQVSQEMQYKLKVTENGQPDRDRDRDHAGQLDDLSLPLSESNGSSGLSQEGGHVGSMLSLSLSAVS